jgi:hypothetical protein
MNWEGCRRKRPFPNFKVLSWHSPGGTEEGHEKHQSGWSVSIPLFETMTSRLLSRRVNHSSTTFGVACRFILSYIFICKMFNRLLQLVWRNDTRTGISLASMTSLRDPMHFKFKSHDSFTNSLLTASATESF